MAVIIHCSGFKVGRKRLKQLAQKVLEIKGVNKSVEIVFVNRREIKRLNFRYLGRNHPTDVLSFPFSGDDFILPLKSRPLLGQIFICYPQAIAQAKQCGHSLNQELSLLVVHGILHLLGFKDETPEGKAVMKEEENRLLSSLLK